MNIDKTRVDEDPSPMPPTSPVTIPSSGPGTISPDLKAKFLAKYEAWKKLQAKNAEIDAEKQRKKWAAVKIAGRKTRKDKKKVRKTRKTKTRRH